MDETPLSCGINRITLFDYLHTIRYNDTPFYYTMYNTHTPYHDTSLYTMLTQYEINVFHSDIIK